MPKGGLRHAIVQSKHGEEMRDEGLHLHYCLCGEFILVLDCPLLHLPRRPADSSFCLLNVDPPSSSSPAATTTARRRTYKLNVSEEGKDLVKPPPPTKGEDGLLVSSYGTAGKNGNGVLVNRDGGFEYQRRLFCPRCQLQVAYETKPGEGAKGDVTFILAGALSDVQNKAPPDAFGPPASAQSVAATASAVGA
ncbi:hypothetical protein JCM8547_002245 [Rhodosporidiobolus lusitaniae]